MKCANGENIIVADDDMMIRTVLRGKFEALGFNVFLTADGQEAVGLASRINAVLIILDLQMPKLNGILACERIRQMPCNAQTPIVILTSIHEKSAEAAGLKAGASAYFTKPFVASLLVHELARHLPVSDAIRDMLRRDAERAHEIAQPGSKAPNPYGGLGEREADSRLGRGKYVIDVLRG